MKEPFYQQYLTKLRAQDGKPCACGEIHNLVTQEILVGEDLAGAVSERVEKRLGANARIWVLSDERTEQAAGSALKRALSRFNLVGTMLDASPRPRTTPRLIARLTEEALASKADLILAVGGGTISDVAKRVSLEAKMTNWCFGTAPSVDAYTSRRAAVKGETQHTSEMAMPSEVVFCDLAVMAASPNQLHLAGIGDLLGKLFSRLDWILASRLSGEHICEEASRISYEVSCRALEEESLSALIDALLTLGLVMQALDNSRSAASSEHTVAHTWEISGLLHEHPWELHGIFVGYAGRWVLEAYQRFFKLLEDLKIDIPARLEVYRRDPYWGVRLEDPFTPYRDQILEEIKGMPFNPGALELRLQRFLEQREEILAMAREILEVTARAKETLVRMGFPFHLEAMGAPRAALLAPFKVVHVLRNRYNAFNLMRELGVADSILEDTFRDASL